MKAKLSLLLLSSLLFAMTVAWVVPAVVAAGNVSEVRLEFQTYLATGGLALAAITLLLAVPGALATALGLSFLPSLFAALSIAALVNALFLVGNLGPLDGRGMEIEAFSALAFAQSGLLAVLLAGAIVFRKTSLPGNAVWVALVIAASTMATNLFEYYSGEGGQGERRADFSENMLLYSQERNALHIILDELQGETFEEALTADPSLLDTFRGFTLFSNAISNYPTTIMSLPAMESGEVLTSSQMPRSAFLDDLKESGRTLEKQLAGHGYDLAMVGGCTGLTSDCVPPTSQLARQSLILDPSYLRLMDVGLLRAAPDYLKRFVYRDESWVFQAFAAPTSYDRAGHVGRAFRIFSRYIAELSSSSSKAPSYKILHNSITHAPVWLDADCRALEEPASTAAEPRLEEALCALGLVERLFQRLKDLGVYDQTLIVISSDHGAGLLPDSLRGQDAGTLPYGRASATLLIKPLSSEGDLAWDDYPALLSDIPATVLDGLGLQHGLSGASLLSDGRPDRQERWFYDYDWDASYAESGFLPPLLAYKVGRMKQDFSSWELVGEDSWAYESTSFPAERLASQVGFLEGGKLIAREGQSKAGFLSFGPYEQLPKGRYRATVTLAAEGAEDSILGWWDVTRAQGTEQLHLEQILGGKGEERSESVEFLSKSIADLHEIRVFYHGVGALSVSRITIEMLEQAPSSEGPAPVR